MCINVVRDKGTFCKGVIGSDVFNTVTAIVGENGVVFPAVHPIDLGHMSDLTLSRGKNSRNHHYSDNQKLAEDVSSTGISDLTETFHQLMASNFIEDNFIPDLDLLHLSNDIRSIMVG